MRHVKVLGSGCRSCRATLALLAERASALGAEIDLEKVEDLQDLVSYGVMSTPAVVVDGVVVHAGGVPAVGAVDAWLR